MKKAQIIDEHIPSDHSFAVFHKICHEYAFLWHYHPTCEIFFPVRGGGKLIVGNILGEFRNGEIIYASERLPHVFYTNRRKETGYEFYKIHFSLSLFAKIKSDFPEARKIVEKFDSPEHGIWFPENNQKAFKLVKTLYQCYQKQDPRSVGIFIEILSELAENKSAKNLNFMVMTGNKHAFNTGRLQKICTYLHRNFSNRVSLNELANFAAMSKSNLCAFFKKSTNTSIIDYVNRLRIDKASSLLIETDDRISDIAIKSGYKTLSHFNREFRKFKGITPKVFRNRNNN